MKKIKLTCGLFALVDDDVYEELNKHNWYSGGSKQHPYARRSKTINGKKINIVMHRVIMGDPKGKEIDHKDHNTLNNQRSNLRICTRVQNSINTRTLSNNKSGYKGVIYAKACTNRPWACSIGYRGKNIYGGAFPTKELAAAKYNELAKKYYGEFAYLNEINKAITNLLEQKGK